MLKLRSTKLMCLLIAFIWTTVIIGSSYAYFIDSVQVNGNIVTTGNLKAEMQWSDDMQTWHDVVDPDDSDDYAADAIFSGDRWEPNYTEVKYIRIKNTGNLAFQYRLDIVPTLSPANPGYKLGEVIEAYVDVVDGYYIAPTGYKDFEGRDPSGTIASMITSDTGAYYGTLLDAKETITLAVALHMQHTAGNEYQGLSVGDGFNLRLYATQTPFEYDSFGNTYDEGAASDMPKNEFAGGSASGNVSVVNGVTTTAVTLSGGAVQAYVPAGVKVNDGVTKLTLAVTVLEKSQNGIKAGKGESLLAVDVHVDGLSANNTVPLKITLSEALAAGLNVGNTKLTHVENGQKLAMTQVMSEAELTVHNQYYYNPVDGTLTLNMATFSEVAAVSDEAKAWEGNFDYSWYTGAVALTEGEADYVIANADQLAGFGAIVGGMNGQTQDSFAGKTIKLIVDVNLGDKENANESLIFHPIGYYYTDDKNADGTTGDYYSTVYEFKGIFDGNGHTISNFYQNTWEIKGDYDGNYYKDAMGLFGYLVGTRDADGNPTGGIVKNLTVDNFSSDGEYTPTGVIAAYAVNSTFENIAITNCNPRVYNTGNGGIIGIAGNSNDQGTQITLRNITVDNSNKITALWGSWDVACGGLVGMFRGNADDGTGEIHFENCHVSAQIDVYNDVCANYQYYAYRYAGMIIGSIRHNTTNDDGKTIPNMKGISASGCTVNYGDWNDYYYCEFEKNSMASYSEDYQFSRVPHSELEFTDSNSNGVVDADERASVTGCKHDHTAEENHQAIYLPFHQLFTGYSWGVSSIGLEKYSGIVTNLGITEGDQQESVEKFAKADNAEDSYTTGTTVAISELFKGIENTGVEIKAEDVQVFVSPADKSSDVTATYVKSDTTNWEDGTLTFSGVGAATITITDYYFCTPTTITVTVNERQEAEKFDIVMNNGDFLHRVGNSGTVALDKLFKAKDGAPAIVGNVSVSFETVNGNASGTYTSNTTWTNGTIKFTGTGVVKVTITDNDYCIPTVLELEVVDAVNATRATNSTSNNVVLLNDCGFSSLEVSGGYTLYGNGFTMTCGSDSPALDMGYSFVTLNNGTLDNVQIVCPNFDYAALYKSNLTSSDNRSETTDRTRYYNAKSGVMVSGNSQILNSRISGGRASVNVSGGNVVIDNSRVELGAVASLLVGAANSLTLRDVTLVQKPTASTYDSNKKLMGFSVLYLCDSDGKATPTTLEGSFVQHAWVNADDKKYVPSAGQDIVDGVMKETAFIHNINGKDSLNLGFAYMPEDAQKTVEEPNNITDNRVDKATIPYEMKAVKIQIAILSTTVYVYSYKNTNGTADSFKKVDAYVPNKYSDIITVTYSDPAEGLTTGKSFGTNGWVYELNVDLDKLSGYKLDFSKLSMSVNGVAVTDFKVNGSAKPTSSVAVTAGGVTYTLTATVNGKEYTATYKVTGTETSKESPSLVASNYEAGLCVASSYGGTWHGAAPALQGIQIKYWSVAEKQYKTIKLSDYTPTTKGQLNGTNTTWTYSPANGDFTLTLTGGQVHSSNNVYAMPVVCDGKLYFVAAKSNGLVNSGNSARTIPVSYTFKDNNNGDVLTFSHTWSVAENKDAQYKYSDFCNGTLTKLAASSGGGSTGCVTPDTLITLANGTQVRVDNLTGNEKLLVWNMETGMLDEADIMFVDNDPKAEYEIVHLYFSDGTDVKVIYEHGFWDYNLNKYVYLDKDAEQYIGHTFAKQNGNELAKVKLTEVVIEKAVTTAWSPVTADHLCYFVNGMLSMPGGVGGLFNIFDVDAENMAYNMEALARDIETYGLFTYEELNAIVELPEEMFNAAGGAYLKVSIGKGNMTMEELIAMIERYTKHFE